MSSNRPQQLNRLLRANPKLSHLLERTAGLLELQKIVRANLDPELAPHCRVLGYQQGILQLEVDSPIWQWRLNMNRSKLLQTLRYQGLSQLTTLTSKVSPKVMITTAHGTQSSSGYQVDRNISAQSAEALEQLAERVPEPLRQQLLKLAAHKNDKASN